MFFQGSKRERVQFSLTTLSIILLLSLVFVLCACNEGGRDSGQANDQDSSTNQTSGDGGATQGDGDASPNNGSVTSGDESDYLPDGSESDYIPNGNGYLPESPEATEQPMLERDENGVFIGSIEFNQPIMLVGNFREPETEINVINVRTRPAIESEIAGQINYRRVVEATGVVDGWYRVTVLSNNQMAMITGFIRSDLLKEYSEEDAHNRVQIGSRVFDEPVLLVGAVTTANVRSGPGILYPVVASVGFGQVAEATQLVDGWYDVTIFPGMFTGFVDSELLVEFVENRQFFAHTRRDVIGARESELVDVRTVIPDILYDLVFATPDNFTGETQYARAVPILQSGTAEKLRRAQEAFKRDGFRIKIYDAYRTSYVSGILFDIVRDTTYVARAGQSTHNRAAAIDMTLVDADGNELEMPSPMHTFNRTSHRNSTEMSEAAKRNMDYMTGIMVQNGFTTIQSEWWHFNDSEASRYPVLDFTFREFTFYFIDN